MSLTEVSARFFLELALGLMICPLLVDRRTIGAGFVRMMALIAAVGIATAIGLSGTGATALARVASVAFLVATCVLLVLPGRWLRIQGGLVVGACLCGTLAVIEFFREQMAAQESAHVTLFAAGGLSSAGVLGLVTGAMILGHWYLVTPGLPISFLARVTRWSLASIYLKALLFAVTLWLFYDQFQPSLTSVASSLGIGEASSVGGFQKQLDSIYLLARVFIGLVGPAALCHMTIATVKLKATQPATGILYAATILVLMGELFAFLGEQTFEVVL